MSSSSETLRFLGGARPTYLEYSPVLREVSGHGLPRSFKNPAGHPVPDFQRTTENMDVAASDFDRFLEGQMKPPGWLGSSSSERVLWKVSLLQSVEAGPTKSEWKPGWFVITTRRLLFFRATATKGLINKEVEAYDSKPSVSVILPEVTETRISKGLEIYVMGGKMVRFYSPGGPAGVGELQDVKRRLEKVLEAGRSRSSARAPSTSTVVHERIITREVVKIPCRYCGGLMENTASRCVGCGAPAR